MPVLACALLSACATPPTCPRPNTWLSPANLHPAADPIPQAAHAPVILLGETHDSAADHAWQLATIQRLHATAPNLVLGFEMFPRSAQPVLDAWSQGRLTEAEFLARTDWQHVWGFPPELYLPIFRYARDNHLPMLGLNVSQHLVHLAGHGGWPSVPAAAREGVADPAPPSAEYRDFLTSIMQGHGGPALSPASLSHFIDAQLVWDSAMAQALAAQHARAPGRLVVAIMGEGHLEHRWGVPHQLDALGVQPVSVLLPFHDGCTPPGVGTADALFAD